MNKSKKRSGRHRAKKAGVSVADIRTSKEDFDDLLIEDYIFEAKRYFQLILERVATHNVEFHIDKLREYAKKAGVSVADIGTSEEELNNLLIEGYISEAKKCLQFTRERVAMQNVEFHIDKLREYAKKAGVSVADIGTSEEELNNLLIEGYISEYKRWFQQTLERVATHNVEFHIDQLREYAKKAGVSVADIGTSEEELNNLLIKGYISEAKKCFRLILEQVATQNVELHIHHLREYAKKAGVSVADIGTSEEELNSLLIEGYISKAKNHLQLSLEQDATQNVQLHIDQFRKYAKKAGVSVAKIGTSAQRIASLFQK